MNSRTQSLTPVWLQVSACCCSPSLCLFLETGTPHTGLEEAPAKSEDSEKACKYGSTTKGKTFWTNLKKSITNWGNVTVQKDTLTSAGLWTKLRVMRSMCVYSVSSSRFL